MRVTDLIAIAAAVLTSACSRETPVSPTPLPVTTSPLPPAESIVQINVLGEGWVFLNSTPVQMTARVALSITDYIDDTDRVTWSVDAAGVAAIDRQGRLTPLASGSVTVSAAVGAKVGRRTIRVLPNYSGSWSGEFKIVGCTGAPDFRTCSRLMGGDGLSPFHAFALTLAQDRDVVTGTLLEPQPIAPLSKAVTGFVRVSGALVLEATVPQSDLEPVRITNWSSSVNAANTEMAGGFTRVAPGRTSLGGFLFTIRTENEFVRVMRTR